MKKLYYLLALIAVVFTSCDPLSQTYKNLDALPAKPGPALSVTLPTTYLSITQANLKIPATLASSYPTAVDGTAANVTFPLSNAYSNIQIPDSLTTRVSYTLSASAPNDYVFPVSTLPNGVAVPANTTTYFTSAGVINYLNYRFPTPVANQIVALTYLYFETGGTAATGNLTTDTFVYLTSGWTKLYTVSTAQYASVNRTVGTTGGFLTNTDYPVLAGYFNVFLKADPLVMISAKVGSVTYVSYKVATFTKVMALTYDGDNWQLKITLPYLKISGTWVPDPTVYIVEPVAKNNPDYVYLQSVTTVSNQPARDNLASFGDFNTQASSTLYWSDDDINAAFNAILLHRITNPIIGVPYNITYSYYPGFNPVLTTSKTFVFDGTSFVIRP